MKKAIRLIALLVLIVPAIAAAGGALSTSTVSSLRGLKVDAYEKSGAVAASYDDCDDWVTKAGETRKKICGLKVTVTSITKVGSSYQCVVDYPKPTRLKARHKTVLWHLEHAAGLNAWDVQFPDFRSIPAVGFYDDYHFADWERRGNENFVWQKRRKHEKDVGSNYFVMIRFVDPTDVMKTVHFCEVVDPIITNDATTDDDPGDS